MNRCRWTTRLSRYRASHTRLLSVLCCNRNVVQAQYLCSWKKMNSVAHIGSKFPKYKYYVTCYKGTLKPVCEPRDDLSSSMQFPLRHLQILPYPYHSNKPWGSRESGQQRLLPWSGQKGWGNQETSQSRSTRKRRRERFRPRSIHPRQRRNVSSRVLDIGIW